MSMSKSIAISCIWLSVGLTGLGGGDAAIPVAIFALLATFIVGLIGEKVPVDE